MSGVEVCGKLALLKNNFSRAYCNYKTIKMHIKQTDETPLLPVAARAQSLKELHLAQKFPKHYKIKLKYDFFTIKKSNMASRLTKQIK